MTRSLSSWPECVLLCLHTLPLTSSCELGHTLLPAREYVATTKLGAKQSLRSLG